MTLPRTFHSLTLALVLLAIASRARAQELDARTTDRCVRAAARIVVLGPDGEAEASGSGTVIGAGGYILTNFHVVGNVSVEHGTPGSLLVPDNRFEVAIATSAREAVQPRYVARVVRADARLDLALLRIIATTDGRPLARGTRFSAIDLADTSDLRPGSRVWAFGFPLNVRTINVTGGQVTGFQMNADAAVAWLRSDAEFNPGNSGGMLVDARGRLVAIPTAVVHGRSTLEPIELARPAERVPRAWLADMRRGIDDVRIDGVPELTDVAGVTDAAIGDIGGIGDTEIHFYRIPNALRPARISVIGGEPELVIADATGRIVRRGAAPMEVRETDPPNLLLATVTTGAAEHPLRFELRIARVAPSPRIASTNGTSPVASNAAPLPPVFGPPSGPTVLPPPATPAPNAAGAAAIQGVILDARTGRPLPAVLVIVGRPDMDLARAIALFIEGSVDEPTFVRSLVGVTRTDASGQYVIGGLPINTRYPAAAVAPGRAPVMLSIAVGNEGTTIQLNPIAIGN